MAVYHRAFPELAHELRERLHGTLPEGWDSDIPVFPAHAEGLATRLASGQIMNAIAARLPALVGGSAGSRVSLITAFRHPDQIAGLLILWVSGGPIGLMTLAGYYCGTSAIQAVLCGWLPRCKG